MTGTVVPDAASSLTKEKERQGRGSQGQKAHLIAFDRVLKFGC